MSTVIYPSPIFGPVHSRRLGVSLGINLLPADGKFCTFDCIYCECGFNADYRPHQKLPTREEVRNALESRLQDMKQNGPKPDVLTFAGNGESFQYFGKVISCMTGSSKFQRVCIGLYKLVSAKTWPYFGFGNQSCCSESISR